MSQWVRRRSPPSGWHCCAVLPGKGGGPTLWVEAITGRMADDHLPIPFGPMRLLLMGFTNSGADWILPGRLRLLRWADDSRLDHPRCARTSRGQHGGEGGCKRRDEDA